MSSPFSTLVTWRHLALLFVILMGGVTGELSAQQINANFTAAPIPARGCAPFTVSFIDLSPNTVTTWAWDFQNDGTVDATVRNPTFTYTTPGVYTVRLFVTDAPGPNTGTIVITSYVTVFAPPVANAGPAARILCNGSGVQIGGTPTASGGAGGYTYQWTPATGLNSTTAANPTASPTSTTTYTVRVTDANGCTATSSTTVTVVQRPTANAGASTAICSGGGVTLGSAPTATGGTGPYTYFWSPSTGLNSNGVPNPVATPGSTTTYNLTVTDANGCTGTSSTTVTVRPNPTLNTGGDRNLCVGSSLVLGGAPTASGATPPYSYSWVPTSGLSSTTSPNPIASPTSTTIYNLTVTDANGCISTGSATVNVRPLPTANAGAGGNMCRGGGVVIGGAPTAAGGSGSYSYSWTPTTGLSSPTAANPIASPPTTTTYTVVVTDIFGCTATSSTTVTVLPRTALSVGGSRSICLGESTVLGGSPTASGGVGGYVYLWSPADGLSSTTSPNPIATPTTSTNYTLQVTDANGCVETGSVMVVVRSRPTVSAGAPHITCSGTGVRIGGSPTASGGSGGYSYSWSPAVGLSSTTAANPTANPPATTTYTVVVTDGTGCRDSAITTVTVLQSPVASAGSGGSMCRGGSVIIGGAPTAAGGTGPYTYVWSPAAGLNSTTAANPVATPTSTTTYTVLVTDLNGCTSSASTTVTVLPTPVARAGSSRSICLGSSTVIGGSPTASGGAGSYTYVWSPADGLSSTSVANPVASPTATTAYSLRIIDNNGCTDSSTVTVTVNPRPTASAGLGGVVCGGSSMQIGGAPTASGGTGPYTYNWIPAVGLNSTTDPNPIASPLSTTTYRVVVTDVNGCADSSAVTVLVNPRVGADAGSDRTICLGSNTQIGGAPTATGGTAPFTYRWDPPAGLSATTVPNPIATPTATTTYTLIVADGNGCADSSRITVTVAERPVADAGPARATCSRTGITIGGAPTASAGTPPYSYRWSPATGLDATDIPNPTAAPVGTTTYTVTVTDANGCRDTSSVLVTAYPAPIADAGADRSLCVGSATLIGSVPTATGGTPPYSYRWSPSNDLSSTIDANPLASPRTTTAYTVIVTDANGCSDTNTVNVVVNPLPVINTGGDRTLCSGSNVTLGATPTVSGGTAPYSYRWTPSVGLSATDVPNPVADPIVTTVYQLEVTDATGCRDTSRLTVTVLPSAVADAGPDTTICFGANVRIGGAPTGSGGSGSFRYRWTPSTGLNSASAANPIASPSLTTTYTVTVADTSGCFDTASVTVTVNQRIQIDPGADTATCRGVPVRIGGIPTVQGGAAPYIYRWFPATGLNSTAIANPIAAPDSTTTYRLEVTDALGCRAISQPITVVVNQLPTAAINAVPSLTFCENDSTMLDAGPGFANYRWSTGETTRRIFVTQPGPYSVTVGNVSGCIDSAFVVTQTIPRPRPTIVADRPTASSGEIEICDVDSVTLDGGANYSAYLWSTGDTTRRVTVRATGSYWVTTTAANGCDGVSPPVAVRVFRTPQPVIRANGPLTFCEDDSVTLDAGPGYSAYRWSTGDSTRAITVKTSGFYTVNVVTGSTCNADAAPVRVDVRKRPVARATALGPVEFCEGDSVVLDGGRGHGSYQWNTGDTTRWITVGASGRYSVTVSDTNACPATSAPIIIDVHPTVHPTISANGPTEFCQGDSVTLDAGPSFVKYLWNTGAITRWITVKKSGNYAVRVTTPFNCVDSASMQVVVGSTPMATITPSGPTAFCEGDSVVLDAGADYATYQWSTGDTTRTITARTAGRYSVVVATATDCIDTASADVTVKTLPTPAITVWGSTRFCEGDSVKLEAPRGFALYQWSTGETTRTIIARESGDYWVSVRGNNTCEGRSSVEQIEVIPLPKPTITVKGARPYCEGGSITLDAGVGGAEYFWRRLNAQDPDSVVGRSRTITVTQPGTYTFAVSVSNIDSCTATSRPFTVTLNPKPVARVTVDRPLPATLCRGEVAHLDGGRGYAEYTWFRSEGIGAASTVYGNGSSLNVAEPGFYTLVVGDANGCRDTSEAVEVVVNGIRPVAIAATGNNPFCEGDSVVLDAGPGYRSYRWLPGGEKTQTITATKAGIYRVVVIDSLSCSDTSSPLALTVAAKIRPRIAPAGTITFCPCDSVLLDAGADYGSIRWIRTSGGVTDTLEETSRRIYTNVPGAYSIVVNSDGCRETSPTVFLSADVPTSSVTLPTLTGVDPGTVITVPLRLKSSTNLDRCGWNSYTTQIRFNGNVMQPLDLVPECIETGIGNECLLTVTGDRRNGDSAGVLQKLRFMVMLGDSERSELHFESFRWNECSGLPTTFSAGPGLAPQAPEVAMTDGQVQVAVCRAGGTRLFHSTGRMELKQNAPNPFGGSTAIEYETTETGRTRLIVTDMAGREVAVLVDGEVTPGRYTVQLESSTLSSGTYYYTLQTPTRQVTRTMQLKK